MSAPASDRSGVPLLVWKGASVRGVTTIVVRAATFLSTILVIHAASPVDAGAFFLALATASILGPMLSLGVAEAIAKRTTAEGGHPPTGKDSAFVRAALRLVALTAGIVLVSATVVTGVTPGWSPAWASAVAVLSGALALEAVAAGFLRARGRAFLAEIAQGLGPVVFVSVLALATRGGRTLPDGALAMRCVAELVATLFVLVAVARLTRGRHASPGVRAVLGAGLPFWVAGLSWLALQNADVLILGMAAGPGTVAAYVPVLRTADLSVLALGLFGAYVLPAAASIVRSTGPQDVEPLYLRASAAAVVLGSPVLAALLVVPVATTELLFGHGSTGIEPVARILALGYAANLAMGLNGVVLQAIGDAEALARRSVIVLAVVVAVDVVAIPTLGMTGAALGTLVGFVTLNVANSLALRRRLDIHPFRRPLLPAAIGSAAAISAWALVTPPPGAVGVVLVAGSSLLASCTGAWWGATAGSRRSTAQALEGAR